MRRSNRSSRNGNNNNGSDSEGNVPPPDTSTGSNTDTNTSSPTTSTSTLPQHIQQRNRSIAEREASRLARPDRPRTNHIGHANRSKSAVSSTPFGFDTFKQRGNNGHGYNSYNNDNDDSLQAEEKEDSDWCGPFSVARQMIAQREEARRKREEEQRQQQQQQQQQQRKHLQDNSTSLLVAQHPLDDLARQVELERKRKAHPSMTWKPTKSKIHENTYTNGNTKNDNNKATPNLYYKRQKRIQKQQQIKANNINGSSNSNNIPSLFQLCVNFIVQHFEHVESLGYNIDNSIRKAICQELVANGKMNGAAFDTIAEEGIETLEIVDCTCVTSDQLAEALNILIPAGLRALILDHAGRCFTSKTVDSIVKHHSSNNDNDNDNTNSNIQLFALSISGAYLLKDSDIAKLISVTAPTLSSIQLKACPLIGLGFCTALATHFSSNIGCKGACLLELSLEDIPSLTKEQLLQLTSSSSDALKHLKSLTLKHMDAIDDEVVHKILASITSGNLEGINLSNNIHLTDNTLSSIRKYNINGGRLKSLQLSGIKNFTSAGLEAFFTFDIPGLPHPPSLRTLDLSDCDIDAVTESVVNLAIFASALKKRHGGSGDGGKGKSTGDDDDNDDIIASSSRINNNDNVSTLGGIVSLDVSGSAVNDFNMENLASYCHASLKELKLNFCTNVSDKGLGYLVSKVKDQFHTLEIWGCAQITDAFLDGHCRVDKGGLDIIGSWMSRGSKNI